MVIIMDDTNNQPQENMHASSLFGYYRENKAGDTSSKIRGVHEAASFPKENRNVRNIQSSGGSNPGTSRTNQSSVSGSADDSQKRQSGSVFMGRGIEAFMRSDGKKNQNLSEGIVGAWAEMKEKEENSSRSSSATENPTGFSSVSAGAPAQSFFRREQRPSDSTFIPSPGKPAGIGPYSPEDDGAHINSSEVASLHNNNPIVQADSAPDELSYSFSDGEIPVSGTETFAGTETFTGTETFAGAETFSSSELLPAGDFSEELSSSENVSSAGMSSAENIAAAIADVAAAAGISAMSGTDASNASRNSVSRDNLNRSDNRAERENTEAQNAAGGLHSQTIGENGPVLVQDTVLHETLETFVNTNFIQRVVHNKGFGAFGHFRCLRPMGEYTRLCFLQSAGQQTPVATRFSLAVSTKGTPDTSRNIRGFSTKFYTDQGIFDILCNHIPVFLVRDAIRFPEAVTSLLPSPVNNLINPERFWDFIARAPEATNLVTWLYSDAGTLRSFRHMRGYGVNTYVWINSEGHRRFVKYHWLPAAGEEFITASESVTLAGTSPDIAGKDLYDTISRGERVEYELRVQMMEPEDSNMLPFDPLDDTKIWDEQLFPLIPVGRLVLDRNPEDYLNQIEKLAFSPSNLRDGAELSDDKMLQGRSFVYWDAQRRRLGPDFRSVPVNRQQNWSPESEVSSGNGSFVQGHIMRSEILKRDDFSQAGERYMSLSEEQQAHLVDNIASELYTVNSVTRNIVVGYFRRASNEFAEKVEQAMARYS